jgi:acetolactate synthase-1/2/3 large subunit
MSAERPLIMAGNGVIWSGASAALLRFAEHTGIPVITTLHGKGAFPEDHPLSLGMPGMHGWVHVNRAIQECDVLCNIGGRFDDRVTGKASTFAPRARIIHVDIDPAEIGKNVPVAVALVGDAGAVLDALLAETRRCEIAGWVARICELRSKYQPRQAYAKRPETAALMPHDVYEALDRACSVRGGCRIVTDVGQHQMWAAQLIQYRDPRSHITSGGAGTMGFSVPAALGVALACPDEIVWVICGDGGFQMTNQELATIKQEDVRNIRIAIINNGYLGMVRQWQELFENRRYSGTPLSGPDFALLAEAYGLCGMRVQHAADVEAVIENAWDYDGCVVIDFQVEREVNVFPIVPQGRSIGEMITEGVSS